MCSFIVFCILVSVLKDLRVLPVILRADAIKCDRIDRIDEFSFINFGRVVRINRSEVVTSARV